MAVWNKENELDNKIKVVLFLVSPFLSLLYSLRTIKTRSSYLVFYLFAVFFGMAFSVPIGTTPDFKGDGAVYREWFESSKYITKEEYMDGLSGFLTFDEGKKDYYFETVAYYVSKISHNYHVMFMIFAIVFAYFALKSYKILTSENNFNTSIACFILSYLFMYNQIFNINGVRFWTASWIGVYAVFQIFKNGNNRYWLLALITPFFHGSFWIFIAVIALAYFLRRFEKLWIVLFIISFLVSNIAIEIIQASKDYLPGFLSGLVDFYTDTEYVELRNSVGTGFSWIPYFFNLLFKVYINIMVYLFIKNSKIVRANKKTNNLYLFLLVWMTFVNFVMFVPSLGVRFVTLAYPVIAYIWLVNFKGRKYQQFLYIFPFILTWNIYTMIMEYNSVLSFDFYFTSPFFLIYKYLFVA